MAPPYLTSYCTPVSPQTGRSKLRSATTGQLVVPPTSTAYGSRSFAVHGPVVWNSLPAELRSPDMTQTQTQVQVLFSSFSAGLNPPHCCLGPL